MVTGQVQRKVNIDLDKVLAQLKKKAVYVGIPKENSKRSDGEMTNASLLMIHSKGSPLRNLPARPVIEPAIEEETNKAKISRQLIAAANKRLNGDQAGFITGLNAAGLQAQNVCREWFKNPKNGSMSRPPCCLFHFAILHIEVIECKMDIAHDPVIK